MPTGRRRPAKNDPATTAKSWASFRPDRIGAGTIYRLAMERGWQPEIGLVLDGEPQDEVHPAAGLLARLGEQAAETAAPRCSAPAFDLVIPDGLVGDLTRYMIATARRPQPLLSLGASLCAIGALMGRLYRTESNLRSNLYVVGIADSGSGKNHAREIVNEVFFEAGLANHLGGNKIASGAGLLTALPPPARHPVPDRRVRHVPLGRRGPEAQPAAHHRNPRQHDGALYGGRRHFSRRRICQPGRHERTARHRRALPLRLWHDDAPALLGRAAGVRTSRTARLPASSSCPATRIIRMRISRRGCASRRRALIDGLQWIADGGGRQRGNLVGKTSGASTAVDAAVVPMTEDAKACFAALSAETDGGTARCCGHGVHLDPRPHR